MYKNNEVNERTKKATILAAYSIIVSGKEKICFNKLVLMGLFRFPFFAFILSSLPIYTKFFISPIRHTQIRHLSVMMKQSMNAMSLRVFDINGRLIETLIDGQIESGFYTVEWNFQAEYILLK